MTLEKSSAHFYGKAGALSVTIGQGRRVCRRRRRNSVAMRQRQPPPTICRSSVPSVCALTDSSRESADRRRESSIIGPD